MEGFSAKRNSIYCLEAETREIWVRSSELLSMGVIYYSALINGGPLILAFKMFVSII